MFFLGEVDEVGDVEVVVGSGEEGFVAAVVDADEGDAFVGEEAAEGGGDGGGVVELEDEAGGVNAELEGGGGGVCGVPLDAEADYEGGGGQRVAVVVAEAVHPFAGYGRGGGYGGVDWGGEEGHGVGSGPGRVRVVVRYGGDVVGVHFWGGGGVSVVGFEFWRE